MTNGINNNLIDSAYTVANQLMPLADNSCVTMAGAGTSATCVKTMALQPTSAAIDAGAANGLACDQRNFAFVASPDMGAFESSAEVPCYTLTYNANGGSGAPAAQSVSVGEAFTTPAAPNRVGYTFMGWKDQDGNVYGARETFMMPAKAVILSAQWLANPATATDSPPSAVPALSPLLMLVMISLLAGLGVVRQWIRRKQPRR